MKFNYIRGNATEKGKLPKTRIISSQHSVFPVLFTPEKNKRPEGEVRSIFAFERRIVEHYLRYPSIQQKKLNELHERLKDTMQFTEIGFQDLITDIII